MTRSRRTLTVHALRTMSREDLMKFDAADLCSEACYSKSPDVMRKVLGIAQAELLKRQELIRYLRSRDLLEPDLVRASLDDNQSLLAKIYHLGPKPALWTTEDIENDLARQMNANRAALSGLKS